MLNLYNQMLINSRGINTVEDLTKSYKVNIENYLVSKGYSINGLSDRAKSILFVALVDILVVRNNDKFYFVTLNPEMIKDNCLNEIPVTNKLIRLDVYNASVLLLKASVLDTYTDLVNSTIYSLSQVVNWHNELISYLNNGLCKVKVRGTWFTCQNCYTKLRNLPTSCKLLTENINGSIMELPLLDITDYKPYEDCSLVSDLYKGIVNINGKMVTLNREILENYYGVDLLYTKLENIVMRYEYCLEELLSVGYNLPLSYYLNKYNLSFSDCKDTTDLQRILTDLVSKRKCYNDSIVYARVLNSKDYYYKIDLSNLGNYNFSKVDLDTKSYRYYAICNYGFVYVNINAESASLAMDYGEQKLKEQLRVDFRFCTLKKDNTVIRGYLLDNDMLYELYDSIKLGYIEGFDKYSEIIYKILDMNNIFNYSDSTIKLEFINNLAKRYGQESNLNIYGVVDVFMNFCDMLEKRKSGILL